MKEIKLTQGKVTLVDDEDYEWLNQWKWYALKSNNTFYAARVYRHDGKCGKIYMHRQIMNNPDSLIDHADTNGLHNFKTNLRKCTYAQNGGNRICNKNRSSKYKGVHWMKNNKKWKAQIQRHGRVYYLGYFNDETSAAKVYDEQARIHFGEFARLNFPNEKLNECFKI